MVKKNAASFTHTAIRYLIISHNLDIYSGDVFDKPLQPVGRIVNTEESTRNYPWAVHIFLQNKQEDIPPPGVSEKSCTGSFISTSM